MSGRLLSDVTGAILAGGRSSRLGTDKALVTVGGKPLIERVADALTAVCEHVILVTGRPETYAFLGLPTVSDLYPGRGPLAGIHAALWHASTPLVFMSACDMPFVTAELVRLALSRSEGYDAVVPYPDGQAEPLQGLYHRRCLIAIEESIAAGQTSVRGFLDRIAVRRLERPEIQRIGDPSLIFFNLNTASDLARAEALAAALAAGTAGAPVRPE